MLNSVHLAIERLKTIDLQSLGAAYELTPNSTKVYERFYGLKSVARSPDTLSTMLSATLQRALARLPDTQKCYGHLAYCKTQTHNTLSDRNWLRAFADAHGLDQWETYSISMTSCASALTLMHFARLAEVDEPLIVLTGEKAFHPSFSRVSVGLLAEVPCAALFNVEPAVWQVLGTQIRHLPRFYQNPDEMDMADRRALQEGYFDALASFIHDSVDAYADKLKDDFIFLPQNLNLPMTNALIRHFNWLDRTYQGDAQHLGHAYCSDAFLNLDALERAWPDALKPGVQVMILTAGTGVTFATCLIERY